MSGGPRRRIKLQLTGTLHRRDFGMVWNSPLITIPDDLTIALQVEATAAQAATDQRGV
jgi:polyisoprenoid-binding protein YceI